MLANYRKLSSLCIKEIYFFLHPSEFSAETSYNKRLTGGKQKFIDMFALCIVGDTHGV